MHATADDFYEQMTQNIYKQQTKVSGEWSEHRRISYGFFPRIFRIFKNGYLVQYMQYFPWPNIKQWLTMYTSALIMIQVLQLRRFQQNMDVIQWVKHRLCKCRGDINGDTVYPKKYAHSFVVLCFVVVMQSFIMNSHEVFIHIHQGCFAGTGAIVRLPQCQWSKPDGYGKISQCITTTKHSKAKTVCIFLGIYCIKAERGFSNPPSGLGLLKNSPIKTLGKVLFRYFDSHSYLKEGNDYQQI